MKAMIMKQIIEPCRAIATTGLAMGAFAPTTWELECTSLASLCESSEGRALLERLFGSEIELERVSIAPGTEAVVVEFVAIDGQLATLRCVRGSEHIELSLHDNDDYHMAPIPSIFL